MKHSKTKCIKHIEYRWVRRNADLTEPDDLCSHCYEPSDGNCPERKTCRPLKITYQLIKKIPS